MLLFVYAIRKIYFLSSFFHIPLHYWKIYKVVFHSSSFSNLYLYHGRWRKYRTIIISLIKKYLHPSISSHLKAEKEISLKNFHYLYDFFTLFKIQEGPWASPNHTLDNFINKNIVVKKIIYCLWSKIRNSKYHLCGLYYIPRWNVLFFLNFDIILTGNNETFKYLWHLFRLLPGSVPGPPLLLYQG